MKALTINQIAGYLPYGLKAQDIITKEVRMITLYHQTYTLSFVGINHILGEEKVSPREHLILLRPLSDLTKEITHNGETFVPIEWFEIGDDNNESREYDHGNRRLIHDLEVTAYHNIPDTDYLPHGVVVKLMEWKFDVFGLIESGLAVDVNTIERNPYE